MSSRISGRKLKARLLSLDKHPLFQKQRDVVGFGRCLAEQLPEKLSINDFLGLIESSITPYIASVSQPSVQQCPFQGAQDSAARVDLMRFFMLERWLIDVVEYTGPKSLCRAVFNWYNSYAQARREQLRMTPYRVLENFCN